MIIYDILFKKYQNGNVWLSGMPAYLFTET